MNDQPPQTDPDFPEWELEGQLAHLFANEGEILAHTLDGVEHRLRARSALATMSDMLSVGIETLGLLLNEPADQTDR